MILESLNGSAINIKDIEPPVDKKVELFDIQNDIPSNVWEELRSRLINFNSFEHAHHTRSQAMAKGVYLSRYADVPLSYEKRFKSFIVDQAKQELSYMRLDCQDFLDFSFGPKLLDPKSITLNKETQLALKQFLLLKFSSAPTNEFYTNIFHSTVILEGKTISETLMPFDLSLHFGSLLQEKKVSTAFDMAAAQKLLFPSLNQIVTPGDENYIAALDEVRNPTKINLSSMHVFDLAFSLAILTAEDARIDETGLHLTFPKPNLKQTKQNLPQERKF